MSQQEMAVARTCYERGQKPSEIAATLGRDKIEYTLLQFSCVFPVAYSSAQFPAVAFQLHSSCKFQLQILFPLGEAFAGAKTKQTNPN